MDMNRLLVFQVSWHVPDNAEIDFALQVLKEITEPSLSILEGLLKIGMVAS
jgi:proteasome activator subunit 4